MKHQNKRKIAFIHPDLGIGGAERLIIDLAVALAKQKHEVLFITNHFDKGHAFPELQCGQFPIIVIGDWLPRSILTRFQALCAYIRMIYLTIVWLLFMRNDDRPDLYFTDLIPIANPLLKWGNEKVIYYCHHPDLLASAPGGCMKKLYRKPIDWLEAQATAKADKILVNSAYTAVIFKETFPNIKQPIEVLYPTIASSFEVMMGSIKTPKCLDDLIPGVKSKGANIIFLSFNRFHPAKKLELAILAMEKLRELTPKYFEKILFVMAGGYDPQSSINENTFDNLTKLVEEKGLQDKIIFLKSPPDTVKAELLFICHCLVYTPVNEHFGIVPLEAMLASKPVIACNSGGPRETVDHGHTGYLCEPNADSLAEFMKRIGDDNVVIMGKAGRRRLDDNFSTKQFELSLIKIVNTLFTSPNNNKKNN